VAKPQWGAKRICPSCGARYYDLHRDPIICPKCGTQYDPEALLKTRRKAPVQAPEPDVEKKPVVPEVEPEAEPEEVEAVEGETPAEGTEEEEEEEVIEDASELGEDEDDMAEVIENVDEEER
jgi:uncharacterized protein (TIGR02300 family)